MNDNVDYRAPAGLFPAPTHRRGGLDYHRFDTLAEAVRYAIEELTPAKLAGAFIETDDIRYDGAEIEALYHASAYPFARLEGAAQHAVLPITRSERSDLALKTISVVPISRGGSRKTGSPALSALPSPTVQPHPVAGSGPSHRYRVGERLRLLNPGIRFARAGAYCQVLALMPYEGRGSLLYRVRSESESFERVVAEPDLSRNSGES